MGREQVVSVSKEIMFKDHVPVTMDEWESEDYDFKPDFEHYYLTVLGQNPPWQNLPWQKPPLTKSPTT